MCDASENDNCDQMVCTPPELQSMANVVRESALPKKSRERYQMAYNVFKKWQLKCNVGNLFSENVFLAYFGEELKDRSPNTLWSTYSMLRTLVKLRHKVDISKYNELLGLLKSRSKGYKAKQAAVFTDEQVQKFIESAPDCKYLATKVILVFGMLGACRSDEMCRMTVNDVKRFEFPERMYLVSIPEQNKTNVDRSFTITKEQYFNIVEKYITLRPDKVESTRFFLTYRDGKCVMQNMGKNKISNSAKEIAGFLLLDPAKFTGHSFRRSSTTTLANAGGDLLQLKRLGGWKSNSVAETYIDKSVYQKKKTEEMITSSLAAATKSDNVSNGRKFIYKTPKLCYLPQYSMNRESPQSSPGPVMDIEVEQQAMNLSPNEEPIRLSQYIMEDFVYDNGEELVQRSTEIGNTFRDSATISAIKSSPNYIFNNCNVTFHISK